MNHSILPKVSKQITKHSSATIPHKFEWHTGVQMWLLPHSDDLLSLLTTHWPTWEQNMPSVPLGTCAWLRAGVPHGTALCSGCGARDHLSQCQTCFHTSLSPTFEFSFVSFTLLFKLMSLTSPPHSKQLCNPQLQFNLTAGHSPSVLCAYEKSQSGVFHSCMLYSHSQATPEQTILPKGHLMNSPAVHILPLWDITECNHLHQRHHARQASQAPEATF